MKPRRNLQVVPEPPKLTDLPELLTPEAAAKLLGIGRTKVYELLTTGEIVGYRPGGRWRLTRAQLAAYLESTLGGGAR